MGTYDTKKSGHRPLFSFNPYLTEIAPLMTSCLRLLLCLLFFLPATAQRRAAQYPMSVRQVLKAEILPAGRQGFILTFVEREAVNRVWQEPGKEPVYLLHQSDATQVPDYRVNSDLSRRLLRLYRNSIYWGGSYGERRLQEVLRDPQRYHLYFVETDLGTGAVAVTDTIHKRREEVKVAAWRSADGLCLVTCALRENRFFFYCKKPGRRVECHEWTISGEDMKRMGRGEEAVDWFRESNDHFYESGARYDVLNAFERCKVYHRGDGLQLLVTADDRSNWRLAIHPDGYELSQLAPAPGRGTGRITPAVLVDSLLVTAQVDSDALQLRFFRESDGALLRETRIHSGNLGEWSSAPIEKHGSFWSPSDLDSAVFSEFLRRARSNGLGLTGYGEDGRLYLAFGALHKPVLTATRLLDLLVTVGGSYALNASPGTSGYMVMVHYGGTPNHFEFGSTVNSRLEPVPGVADYSVWERLRLFLSSNQVEAGALSFFYMDGSFYLGGFFSSDRYTVFRFPEKAPKNGK
ncbi:MAG: hypothetical protein EOO12_14250 [Chitinophagaceae bacterium]|nr:MAG: hypothetical protein EOO12_14250 [Chitinophagaceae bacterium]